MPLSALDSQGLDQAMLAAQDAIGLSEPNPRVGCVIGLEDGSILGVGSTQQAGSAHAETMALRQAAAAGRAVRGATAWVSLEPCAHHGRTPPCCDALIQAGIARVVVAAADPNPLVAGEGLRRLRAAGIRVDMGEPRHEAATRELNIGFFSRHERARPWVRMKAAASLDGRTALPNGVSRWITGEAARADGHAWRKRAGAVLTGIGTALADDPRLDVRLVPTVMQPLRVVVDSKLRLPPRARLLTPPGTVLLATADADNPAAQALRDVGAEVMACPGTAQQVDLPKLLAELSRRSVNELHVEAGAGLNGSLLALGLVDEILLYVAPMLLGPGAGVVKGFELTRIDDAARFVFIETLGIGHDLRVRLRAAT
jgi:diaminohydroxyphosphoribosylaminopyrimidine deaminase / 5-amino-6-(5-phosphoribosylamino)uracil reductase